MEHQFREQYEYELGEYWKAIIKEDVTKGNEINKKFLPPKIRKFIWDISKVLLQDPESIPGSACRIIEQFYAEQVEKYCKCSDFKLPLWNGLETALVIAMAASMKELLMEVSYAMDLAEYRASIINEEICKVSGSKSAICTARLSAGVVVAVAEKNALNMDRVLESVSIYSSLTIDYLKLIKDIIVKYI
ncbi:uncharacterized protein LOC123705520 isoform X2 [Colias croceus]|uniref:uncharacterized protein LOC123705520 isoform X2 n=1 Tax=Colias crocea TaxID=72248 RepID=UPI001E27FC50|nr:uncharacterized protein LOC123705520 isoform X2 [Colias croceus]